VRGACYARRVSAYAKIPPRGPDDEPSDAAELASAVAGRVGRAGRKVRAEMRRASRALDGPRGTEVEALLADTNLPELSSENPLEALAVRIDREGDLWRNLALRELARIAWANRVAQVVAVLALLGDAGLALVAALGALFAGDGAGPRALLVGAGAAVLTVGALVVAWVCGSIRRVQTRVVSEALQRADVAELRLHRIAIALAARSANPAAYADSLARLERDAT
jgi:hypothetical protein